MTAATVGAGQHSQITHIEAQMDQIAQTILLGAGSASTAIPAFGTRWETAMPMGEIRSGTYCTLNGQGAYYYSSDTGHVIRTPNFINFKSVHSDGTPTSKNSQIWGLAASSTRIVAVTATGHVMTSSDGISWSEGSRPVTTQLRSVAFGNGVFVGVGASGKAVWSSDGITFQATDIAGTAQNITYTKVVFLGGYFIALGTSGNMWASPNGSSWTKLNLDTAVGTAEMLDVALSSSGTWVAVGASGRIVSTTNLFGTWPLRIANTTQNLTNVIWHSNLFVIGGNGGTVRTSADGSTWLIRNVGTTQAVHRVRSNGSTILITFNNIGTAAVSQDGTTWSTLTFSNAGATALLEIVVNPSTQEFGLFGHRMSGYLINAAGTTSATRWNGMVFQNYGRVYYDTFRDKFLIFPRGQDSATQSIFVAMTADKLDGFSTTPPNTTATSLYACAFNASTAVIVGGFSAGTTFTTHDYVALVQRSNPLSSSTRLRDVVWAAGLGLFVAVGNSGAILTSPNGTTWTNRSVFGAGNFSAIVWTGTKLIASGDKTFTSTNGTAWTFMSQQGRHDRLSELADGYLYAGTSRSADGISWSYSPDFEVDVGTLGCEIKLGGGVYLGPTFGGRLVRSTNGVNWTTIFTPGSTNWLRSVAWSNTASRWVTVGDGGIIKTSDDAGITWVTRSSGTTRNLSAVHWTGVNFIASGAVNTFLRSSDGISWTSVAVGGTTATYEFIAENPNNGIIIAAPNGSAPVKQTLNHGLNWVDLSPSPGNLPYRACVYSPSLGEFILNRFGTWLRGSGGSGSSWTTISTGMGTDAGLAYKNGRYIIGTITNGICWRDPANISVLNPTNLRRIDQDLQFLNGKIYISGDDGLFAQVSEDDGATWDGLLIGNGAGGRSFGWTGEIYVSTPSAFNSAGATIYISDDGRSFQALPVSNMSNQLFEALVSTPDYIVGVSRYPNAYGIAYTTA